MLNNNEPIKSLKLSEVYIFAANIFHNGQKFQNENNTSQQLLQDEDQQRHLHQQLLHHLGSNEVLQLNNLEKD